MTVFLTGSECPFTCVFCDLWRQTLDGPTPAGAIPSQLDRVLAELTALEEGATIKLYNASNFFDRRAVPRSDWPAIAERLTGFERVVVECHPRLVDDSCLEFAALLAGRLEVAMGLETARVEVLARLNKKMTLEDFDRAAGGSPPRRYRHPGLRPGRRALRARGRGRRVDAAVGRARPRGRSRRGVAHPGPGWQWRDGAPGAPRRVPGADPG